MAIKTGSLKKEEGYVADSILIAEIIKYAYKEGPFSYFELIENISEKVVAFQNDEDDEDALIYERNPEKYLDVIVRNSRIFKDYFKSVENDEYHSIETSFTITGNDDDSDWDETDETLDYDDDDDFWQQDMKNKIEKEKIKEEKEELRTKRSAEKEAYCHCTGDGVCYCDFPEEEEPKKEKPDVVWHFGCADKDEPDWTLEEANLYYQQTTHRTAMILAYIQKLKMDSDNLLKESKDLSEQAQKFVEKIIADKRPDSVEKCINEMKYKGLTKTSGQKREVADKILDIALDLERILGKN